MEVLEIILDQESSLINATLKESIEELPSDIVFGPIIRDGQMISPRGETVFEVGDHVLILSHTDHIDVVQDAI